MFIPADSFAGAESLQDLRLIFHDRADNLECARQISRTVLHGEREGLLVRQGEGFCSRVVGHESASRLG